ncbi:hypothetical protein H4S01_001358 [Coemansia sp. RSA 2610]|nr:hypothetical protein H4S01_001358 [Coemansia sp. RSA 2610]
MTQGKRAAVAEASSSKRARTAPAKHADECQDDECAGCADGAIELDQKVLELSASELLAMAEQEEAEGTDQTVVAKLYETALERFGDQTSLPHAWALLRSAEYVDFKDYAAQAIDTADKIDSAESSAQTLLIKGRARVLAVCLDHDNWADPQDHADASDDEGVEIEQAQQRIAGKNMLDKGLGEIAEGLRIANSSNSTLGVLSSLLARHEKHALVVGLRISIMDCAMSLAYAALGWNVQREDGVEPAADTHADMTLATSKAAVYWALAASECLVSGNHIEERVKPALQHLSQSSDSAECCKLHAQLMLVLSGVLSDEDAALEAFDAAVNSLQRAHELSPDDKDILRQLEDLGADA